MSRSIFELRHHLAAMWMALTLAMSAAVSCWAQSPGAALSPTQTSAEAQAAANSNDATSKVIRVGVLSAAATPAANTSQGLYIKILRDAGCSASAVSAEQVRQGALEQLDLFIIGGGSGTKFNTSLGEIGGEMVEQFVRHGGGVIGTCAGGYSFVLGHNPALGFIEVANARCIDTKNGRWARGKGTVEIIPSDPSAKPVKMFYANGPLWQIADEPGFGRIEAVASYKTDIHRSGEAGGIMEGTPAILAGTFGEGRFVLFSAHPEFQKSLGNHPAVVDAANWVTGGVLPESEPITWSAVFPSL